jgi:hypothetical protein
LEITGEVKLRKKGEVDRRKIPIGLTPLGAHPTRVFFRGEISCRPDTVRCASDCHTSLLEKITGEVKLRKKGEVVRGENTHRPDTVRCASD